MSEVLPVYVTNNYLYLLLLEYVHYRLAICLNLVSTEHNTMEFYKYIDFNEWKCTAQET